MNDELGRSHHNRVISVCRHSDVKRSTRLLISKCNDLRDVSLVVEENEIRCASQDMQRLIFAWVLVRTDECAARVDHEHLVQRLLQIPVRAKPCTLSRRVLYVLLEKPDFIHPNCDDFLISDKHFGVLGLHPHHSANPLLFVTPEAPRFPQHRASR